MSITVSVPEKPTIIINGSTIAAIEVKNGDRSFTGNRDPVAVSKPASITMTGPVGSTIRYTFNSKKVNLGSPVYSSAITVRENGNGFDSDTLTVRAKAYLNGESSGTTEVVVKLQ